MALADTAQETVHGEVEGRIVVVYRSEAVVHFYPGGQLFHDFPFQGLLWCFAAFYPATGILPLVFPFAVSALGGEDRLPVVRQDDGCDNPYGFLLFFHIRSLS